MSGLNPFLESVSNRFFYGYILAVMSLLFLIACGSGKRSETESNIVVNSDTAVVNSLIRKANDFAQINFDSMHLYAEQAYKAASAADFPQGKARAKAVEANYQRRKGNYDKAISLGLEVMKSYDSLGMKEESVRLKNIIADTYKEMGGEKGTKEFLSKGLELSRQAERDAEKMKYVAGVVISLNQQGIILRDMSKRSDRKDLMDSALVLYQKGIKLVETTGEGEESLGKLYNNTSQVYNEHRKDYATALSYLNKAVDYNSKRNNLTSLSFNYGNISDVYLRMGDHDKARQYAQLTLQITKQLNAPHRIINACNQLTRVFKKTGQFDSALYYKDWSVMLADSLNNLEKTAQIAEMQTKYEAGKKDAQIEELTELNEVKNQRFWLLAGASLVLMVLLFVVWNQKKKSQRQQKMIAEQSDRLQWMMKELHHRVKNNLQIVSSLLNLQSYRLKDEESVSAIKESQLRVQAMSLMHQRLYQVEDVSMVNFKLYLTDLTETLMRAYGYCSDDFDLTIDIEKEMLDVDTVMPMGLLVNEIITNSFKYAFKEVKRPALRIKLGGNDRNLVLDIADNGPGMQSAGTTKAGFGTKLISALSKQLKATYTVDLSAGTAYSFTIPYTHKKAA